MFGNERDPRGIWQPEVSRDWRTGTQAAALAGRRDESHRSGSHSGQPPGSTEKGPGRPAWHSDQWSLAVCFPWRDGNAHEVEIVDYHW